jgi:hypothetical protein
VLQASHAQYSGVRAVVLSGVRVIVDGRQVLDPEQFPDTRVLTIGAASSAVLLARPGVQPS